MSEEEQQAAVDVVRKAVEKEAASKADTESLSTGLPDVSVLNQEDRWRLFAGLMEKSIGPVDFDGSSGRQFIPLSYVQNGGISPGQTQTAIAPVYGHFMPERLVILEPVIEVVDKVVVQKFRMEKRSIVSGPFWKRRREELLENVLEERITCEEKFWRAVPRGAYTVECVLVGSRVQFRNKADIPGEAFAPGNDLAFDDGIVVEPGISIAVQVRNDSKDAVPFYAVILGKPAPKARDVKVRYP